MVKQNSYAYASIPNKFRIDKEVFLTAFEAENNRIEAETKEERKERLEETNIVGSWIFSGAPSKIKDDKEVVLEVVKKDGLNILWTEPEIYNDKEVRLVAVKQNPDAIDSLNSRNAFDNFMAKHNSRRSND